MVWLLGKIHSKRTWVSRLDVELFDLSCPKQKRLADIWPLVAVIIGQYVHYFKGEQDDIRSIGLLSVWTSIEGDATHSVLTYQLHCDLSNACYREGRLIDESKVNGRAELYPTSLSDMLKKCQTNRQKKVLTRLFEGYKVIEIAKEMNLSPSTISNTVEKLRDQL